MTRSRNAIAIAIVVCVCAVAAGAQPLQDVFLPTAPGSVVQNLPIYFNGRTPNGQSRAVASKKLVGAANGTEFYQWYLSIYVSRRDAYRLRYQSPANGGPLSRVTQAHDAKLWFPVQDLRIVGAVALIQPGMQQLVVQSHEMAADCGSSTVTVFTSGVAGSIVPAVSVSNLCELSATIGGDDRSVVLRGPFYAPNAPTCCPTKPRASSVLRFHDGKWTESPNLYKLYPGRFPPTS